MPEVRIPHNFDLNIAPTVNSFFFKKKKIGKRIHLWSLEMGIAI